MARDKPRKFIDMVFGGVLGRHIPVSHQREPRLHEHDQNPASRVQTKLIDWSGRGRGAMRQQAWWWG